MLRGVCGGGGGGAGVRCLHFIHSFTLLALNCALQGVTFVDGYALFIHSLKWSTVQPMTDGACSVEIRVVCLRQIYVKMAPAP